MKGFKTVSLADQVFERLENDIIQGVYPPGGSPHGAEAGGAPGRQPDPHPGGLAAAGK